MSRPTFDLSVYLVTDTGLCGGPDGVIKTVNQAIDAGVTFIQLRDPHAADDQFVELGRNVVKAIDGRVPLVLDDRVHLVKTIGANGVHVGQSDMPAQQARQILGPDAIIGLTTNLAGEVRAATRLPAGTIDYAGAGAIYATATKVEAAPIGFDGLRQVCQLSPWPVVAIGGITAKDAPAVFNAGGAGLCVVSTICGQPDPFAAARGLVQAWRDATALTQ